VISRRSNWEVLPTGDPIVRWKVTYNGKDQRWFFFKYRAVAHARDWCNHYWTEFKERSELIIKTRDGKISEKESYGDDPRETLG
jgi:hypothetical protein